MKKILWLTLALSLTLTLSAAAEEVRGKIKAVDSADQAIVLEDGTRLWVSSSHLTDLRAGDQVQAVYETQGGKKIVTDLEHRTMGPEGETTNFGTLGGTPTDPIQAGD